MENRKHFVFYEGTILHTGNKRDWSTWDFADRLPEMKDCPTNWETPVNYKDGTYEFAIDILEMGAVNSPVRMHFGWCNIPNDPEIRHLTSPGGIIFDKPLSYKLVGKVSQMGNWYGKGPNKDKRCSIWYWDRAFAANSIYTWINPMSNVPGSDGFPFKIHVKITIFEKE